MPPCPAFSQERLTGLAGVFLPAFGFKAFNRQAVGLRGKKISWGGTG